MTKVKICGITTLADAQAAVAARADALGFVFYEKSPRQVTPQKAAAIIAQLPPFVQTVGLFVDEEAERVNWTADFCGDLAALAGELQLDVLLEVHDERELEMALYTDCKLIGINNRSLHSFVTDLGTTERLAKYIPADRLIVAESGITARNDIERLQRAGAKAFLVGESLMREEDIGAKLQELLG